MQRRRYLALAGGALALAGCATGGDTEDIEASDGDGGGDGDGGDTPTETVTATAADTETATPKPTYSYEAITGTWTGETNRNRHSFAKVEIVKERATAGEEVGTATLFKEKGGEVVCEATLSAHHSDPPRTFWVDVDSGYYPCNRQGRYRFRRSTVNYMHWFIRPDDEYEYFKGAPLSRESG